MLFFNDFFCHFCGKKESNINIIFHRKRNKSIIVLKIFKSWQNCILEFLQSFEMLISNDFFCHFCGKKESNINIIFHCKRDKSFIVLKIIKSEQNCVLEFLQSFEILFYGDFFCHFCGKKESKINIIFHRKRDKSFIVLKIFKSEQNCVLEFLQSFEMLFFNDFFCHFCG